MDSINPIGLDYKDKKYITRSGQIVTLVPEEGYPYLESPEVGWSYLPKELEETGNLVYGVEHPDDIIAEYKGV